MQSELIKRCKQFQQEQGVTSRFICLTIGMDEAYFCRFKKGQKLLHKEHFNALDNFLISKGY